MSGLVGGVGAVGDPSTLLDPTQDELNKRILHGQSVAASGYPVGVVQATLPDPNAQGWLGKLPLQGAAANIIQFLNWVDEKANEYGNKIPGLASVPELPHTPERQAVIDWANRVQQATTERAREITPHELPETPAEARAQEFVEGLGSLGPPSPVKLPKMLGLLMPGLTHPTSIPLAAGVSTVQEVADALTQPKPQGYGVNIPPAGTHGIDLSPTGSAQAAPAQPQQGPTISLTPATFDQPQQPPPLSSFIQGQPATDDTGLPAWAYGLGGLATLGLGWVGAKKGIHPLNRVIDTLSRTETDPAVVSKMIDDANAARNPVIGTRGNTIPEMPLPNNASGFTRRLAREWLNPNAILNETAKGIFQDANDADALIARTNMLNYPAGAIREMEHQLRTGRTPTGMNGPSQYDARQLVDAMTPTERELADSAAYRRAELEQRQKPNGQVVNFPAEDDATLQSRVNQANANPLVKAYLDHIEATNKFIPEDMARMGLITPQQARAAVTGNRYFMPTFDAEGNYLHSWTGEIRDPGTGFNQPSIPAWEAQQVHYVKSYTAALDNQLKREWLDTANRFSRANPEYRNFVVETPEPSNLRPNETVYTSAGPRHFDVNNTYFRNSLKNASQLRLQLMNSGAARRLYQQLTTGPEAALLGGKFFGVTNFLRDVALAPGQMPRGYYTGAISRALGRDVPVYDPTVIPGSIATAGRDVSSALARGFADAFASRDNPLSKTLRLAAGDHGVERVRDWLNQQYLHSNLAFRHAQRVGGGGTLGVNEATTRLTGKSERQGTYRDPMANVAPLTMRPGVENIAEKVPLGKGTVTSVINLRSLLHELHGVVSDAPHSYLFDINKDNPKIMEHGAPNYQRLANTVQQVIGDPATRGLASGKLSSFIVHKLPYANTGIQATAAMGRAFRDHPLMWTGRTASAAALLAAGSQLSALLSGPEHVKDLENNVSNPQRIANQRFYHGPGTNPNVHTEIPVTQEMGFLMPYMNSLMGHFLGTWTAHQNEPWRERLSYALADMFRHHVTPDTIKQTQLGAANVLSAPFQFTPGAGAAISTVTGAHPGQPGQSILQNLQEGRPLLEGLIPSTGDNRSKVPGQEGVSGYLSKHDGTMVASIISSLTGLSGDVLSKIAMNVSNRWQQTHDPNWVLHGLWSDMKQNLAEQNRFGNVVFGKELPMTTQTPTDVRIQNAMRNARDAETAASDERYRGFTRSRGQSILTTGDYPGPVNNPTMERIWQTVGQWHKTMNSRIMPQINDIYKQIQSTRDSAYTADEKVRIINNYVGDLHAKRQELAGEIDKLNHYLSKMAGRHVDISKGIDWKRGAEQFPAN